jgi:c-di-AMP phosphodiesterase-like protein
VIKPWNPYQIKLESSITINQILKAENEKKKFIYKKRTQKMCSSKSILVVDTKPQAGPHFSKCKKKKIHVMLGFLKKNSILWLLN